MVVCLSMGTFMLYFFYLRESSNIDEYLSRPIWERLPGIDPDRAEKMMEVDKYMGLQVSCLLLYIIFNITHPHIGILYCTSAFWKQLLVSLVDAHLVIGYSKKSVIQKPNLN